MKSAPSNLSNPKTTKEKEKCLNFEKKQLYLGILGLEFLKATLVFEMLKFGAKRPLFGYCWTRTSKSYCDI